MNSIHYLRDEIAVVGWSCRLPGANSPTELWSMLLEGRCAVSSVPPDRFSLERFGHPRRQERGKSYTWAAGIIDDLWGFDPSVFGISPREAEQMDPQQRILLQLTWEALEDAGIRPSSIAGSDVGVYVGASQTDYGHGFFGDYASADFHFATGTALAILANRISHIYDLRGPSITVDTACSSSLVAFHEAVEALRSGRVDTAIVGGINVIASPASFIAFSQASMLSPTGLCRAFSARCRRFRARRRRRRPGAAKSKSRANQQKSDPRPRSGDRCQFRRPDEWNFAAFFGGAGSIAATHLFAREPQPRSPRICGGAWHRHARRRSDRSDRARAQHRARAYRACCRSVQSRPISAISSRRPVLPAC